MIDINELRANNWILGEEIHLYNQNIHSNGFTKITAYGIYMLSEHPELAKKYNPISLTTEILEKCGFLIENSVAKIVLPLGDGQELELDLSMDLPFDCTIVQTISKTYVFVKPQKYLHRLQNLYFALTGQELEIKL